MTTAVKITSIEEAIFFLGLRQIRQMAMTTWIIDEMETFARDGMEVRWKEVWRHGIGSAILSREILSMTCGIIEDDTYYICGLLHDIGKLVMMNVYPDEWNQTLTFTAEDATTFHRLEREAFGWTHAEIGALYLELNGLPREIVEAVLFHHEPEAAPRNRSYAAGIQLADSIARYGGCSQVFERNVSVGYGEWEQLSGWQILYPPDQLKSQYARASVLNSIERLPSILHGLL